MASPWCQLLLWYKTSTVHCPTQTLWQRKLQFNYMWKCRLYHVPMSCLSFKSRRFALLYWRKLSNIQATFENSRVCISKQKARVLISWHKPGCTDPLVQSICSGGGFWRLIRFHCCDEKMELQSVSVSSSWIGLPKTLYMIGERSLPPLLVFGDRSLELFANGRLTCLIFHPV